MVSQQVLNKSDFWDIFSGEFNGNNIFILFTKVWSVTEDLIHQNSLPSKVKRYS